MWLIFAPSRIEKSHFQASSAQLCGTPFYVCLRPVATRRATLARSSGLQAHLFQFEVMSERDFQHTHPNEVIGEIAEILAAGLTRLEARKSSQFCRERGESSLDFSPIESADPDGRNPENRDD
jgi:hypothetical protein